LVYIFKTKLVFFKTKLVFFKTKLVFFMIKLVFFKAKLVFLKRIWYLHIYFIGLSPDQNFNFFSLIAVLWQFLFFVRQKFRTNFYSSSEYFTLLLLSFKTFRNKKRRELSHLHFYAQTQKQRNVLPIILS